MPNFTQVVGTELGNTNGSWVTVNPAQPNNIDLIETRLFKMPPKGSGIMGVDFKLVGADGGTATFLAYVAKGGKGGELGFSINMASQNAYGRPFFVTFGKKGESVIRQGIRGAYCSAGGGGSTGMAWVVPNLSTIGFNSVTNSGSVPGHLIAAAGGGSGGFASANGALDGNSSTGTTSQIFSNTIFYGRKNIFHNGNMAVILASGGSALRLDPDVLNPSLCCDNDQKLNGSSSYAYNVFTYQLGVIAGGGNNVLQSLTLGQGGGKPTCLVAAATGTPNATGLGFPSVYEVVQNGGKGGSGFSGGGVGSSVITFFGSFGDVPTSGAGGTGEDGMPAYGQQYPLAADAGWNTCFPGATNLVISPRTPTNSPQSGYFMYRTQADTVKPVIANSQVTLYIGDGKALPFATTATLTDNMLRNAITDNDLVNTITAGRTIFNCSDVGFTRQINVTATDFAGNSTLGYIYVTVLDTTKPVVVQEIPYNPFIPNSIDPNRIDVSSGSYTLTAANFPKGFDGCNGNNVITHFPPTTFTCAHAGTPQPVNFYFTDIDGNNSPTYTKTFNVVYTNTSTVYVDYQATGANNGSSWADAFTNLQDAIRYGCSSVGRTIYVATGNYFPDRGNGITAGDRNASFVLPEGYKLYGGFPHGGDVLSSRNPVANPVVLTGEIGNTASVTDNSYHVVVINGNNVALDGFTIQNGYANNNANIGGGAVLLQQTQTSVYGGFSTTLRNCKFLNNFGSMGGAVYSDHRNVSFFNYLTFTNCLFQGNKTSANGGAVYLNNQTSWMNMRQRFTNCVFYANNATSAGGALHAQPNAEVNAVNCTFGYNKAGTQGGGISNNGTVALRNSIMYFDTVGTTIGEISNTGTFTADYSNVQGSGGSSSWALAGVTNGGYNLDITPQFVPNVPAQVLSFYPQSRCRNAGLASYNSEPYDIAGNIRVSQDTIDIGAYETNPVVYVAADAAAGGDGTSWATAYNKLSDGLNAASSVYLKDVWVKKGTYYPDRSESGTLNQGRFNTFYIQAALKVYGGFAGTETSRAQRNIGLNPAILSGDLGTLNDASDNAYHVVTLNGYDIRLDGFIIEKGNANHPTTPGLRTGGGIYDAGYYSGQNTVVIHSVVRNNQSAGVGGGFYTSRSASSAMNFIQCLFYNNAALRGAAAYIQSAAGAEVTCNMYNCTAVNNTSGGFNAGAFETNVVTAPGKARLYAYNSLWLNNLPQSWNDAGNAGSIVGVNTYISNDTTVITSIGNPAGADGLMMTADDGFSLPKTSPAINFGNNTLAYNGQNTDITGSTRILQNKIDAGAYENWGCLGLTKLYVDAGVDTALGDGSSWQMAFNNLTDALKVANACSTVDSIFIAKGTYLPGDANTTVSTDASFEVWNPVAILGGYPAGGGPRNVLANPVVLSADINTQAKTDNAVHIMRIGAGTAKTTLIDGITFTNGYASKSGGYVVNGRSFLRSLGSCINSSFSRVTVNNCRFLHNYASRGGAIYTTGSFTSINCVYDDNMAAFGEGGAIYEAGGTDTLRLIGNVFIRDTAGNGAGGAVHSKFSSNFGYTDVINNVFVRNASKTQSGGALYIGTGYCNISNNTFYSNAAGNEGGGMFVYPSGATIANNLFWNNTDAGFIPDYDSTDVFNIYANNTAGVNPGFKDTLNLFGADGLWFTGDDGLRLKASSPFVNSGNSVYARTTTDITGAGRIKLGIVDIGAYESDSVVTRWYISQHQDTVHEDGASWATAFRKLEEGLAAARRGDTVWVASGTYTPETPGNYFSMKSGVKIYGGFRATEQTLAQRNLQLGHNAVLQGNGNSIMINTGVDSTALLDGFVLQNGHSAGKGGGILNIGTDARFNNIVLTGNTAVHGGAVANIRSRPHINNAVFYANTASQSGGAIYDSAATATLLHATFYNNNAQSGAVAAQQAGSMLTLGNGISWGNTPDEWDDAASTAAVTYSLLQGNNNGTGNLSGVAPQFSNTDVPAGFDGLWFTEDDGLTATYQSVYLNKGNNLLSAAISQDITGSARIQNGDADMGAYENALLNFCDSMTRSGSGKLYVDARIPASGNGFSWSSALKTLNEALQMAEYCSRIDTIWIAEGTYYPTGYQAATDRTQSFVIPRGNLHLLGGYNSYDTTGRNTGLYRTILNGNINEEAVTADNSFHVVTLNNTGSNVTLDGLIISGGMANSTAPANAGGGLYNRAENTTSSPVISNCTFMQNTAMYGGAVYNSSTATGTASAVFVNCLFAEDTAMQDGGAVYNDGANGNATAQFTNCTFQGSHAANRGGAVYDISPGGTSQSTFVNSLLWGNTATVGTAEEQQIYSNIPVFNGTTTQYSLIEGNTSIMGGNITATGITLTDIFTDAVKGDYTLKAGAPAIDAGSNVLFAGLNTSTKDLAGKLRLNGASIDIGAYEFHLSTSLPVKLLSFTAVKQGSTAELKWTTATEQNSKGFDVQHSMDGKAWESITFLKSKAGSEVDSPAHNYHYIHLTPEPGINFYRLKQEDNNGKFEYSPVRNVYFDHDAPFSIYPNPASDQVTITGLAGNETVTLYDVSGKLLLQQKAGSASMSISLKGLGEGLYYLHVVTEGSTGFFAKIVIAR